MESILNTLIALIVTYNSQMINSNTQRAESALIGCIAGGIMEYDISQFTEQDFVNFVEYKYPICQQYIINNEELFGLKSEMIDWKKIEDNLNEKNK